MLSFRNGNLEVRAPFFSQKTDIDKFVASKENWIAKHLAKANERETRRNSFSLTYGDNITYRGNRYTITEKQDGKGSFRDGRFYIQPNLPAWKIKEYCIDMYKTHAETLFYDIAREYAGRMQVLPTGVKISNARTRWGSCSAKKSINISWRLIMADDDAIEYLIVHELAHLIEHNHSARFWAIVGSYIPDYRERKKKLKALSIKLSYENW